MNTGNIFRFVCIAFFLLTCFVRPSYALKSWDEAEDEREAAEEVASDSLAAAQEMGSGIYGRVENCDPAANRLTVLPTDTVENTDLEDALNVDPQTFRVTKKTTLTGIRSLSEITFGDFVTVDYYAFRGSNIASQVTFEKAAEHSEESDHTAPSGQKDLADFPVTTTADQDKGNEDLVG
ncbi:MAG: hypothetical protein WC352_06610 [Candidatus Omnitrophota bacterium]